MKTPDKELEDINKVMQLLIDKLPKVIKNRVVILHSCYNGKVKKIKGIKFVYIDTMRKDSPVSTSLESYKAAKKYSNDNQHPLLP